MKEMPEQDRQTADAARARRKRIARNVGRVIGLLGGAFWMLLFILALRTGYLSPIGVAVGALFAGSAIAAPVLGWAGRKRLASVHVGLHLGIVALFILSWMKASLWPETAGAWRPYRFNDELSAIEAKRAVPDAENAARRYDALFAKMDMNDAPGFASLDSFASDEPARQPWKSTDHPLESAWLDTQGGVIDKLLEIAAMEKCRWPVQADKFDELTVPYKKLRRAALLLAVAAGRDLGEERVEAALTKYFCLLRMGDHLRQQPSAVDILVGQTCQGLALPMIRRVLVQNDLSDDMIAAVADHLPPTADRWPQERPRLLEFEKLQYMNLMGRAYEVNGDGGIRFSANPGISPTDGRVDTHASRIPRLYWLMSMPRDPRGIRRMADEYFRSSEGQDEPSPVLWDAMKGLCNFYRWATELAFSTDDVIHGRYHSLYVQAVTRRRGTWLVLGLRRYHNAHGAWPETLDPIREYVPAEAFVDPTGNDAFVYGRDDNSFKLYSKGPNHIDEGGRSGHVRTLDKSEDDIAMWPPQPKPRDEESIKEELRALYGKEHVESYLRDNGSAKTMIVDRIENARLYAPLHKGCAKAFGVMADPGLIKKPDGRYEIDGNNVYYIVQHYTTKPVDQGRFESHRQYIDIQALLAGQEMLGYAPTVGLEIVEPYSEEKDIMFYRAGTMIAQTRLEPGLFCLLYPHDAHLPSCQVACPAEVHKVVFKIRLA